jgi:STE24 endopeptidase
MSRVLILIIIFVVGEFIISSILSFLNRSWMSHPIPQELNGLYDDEKYNKQQKYLCVNNRVSSFKRCFDIILILVVLLCGLLGWYDNVCKSLCHNELGQLAIFFVTLLIVTTVIDIPFSWYSTFVIEAKFGFNKTTKKTFWLDILKSTVLTLVLALAILAVIFLLYQAWGNMFWIWSSLFCAIFMIFFSLFYSSLIVPIFNKQKPLEECELRTAIEQAAKELNFSIKNIYVIDGLKHSTKANAYFTGFGRKKRIVLYDTIIDQLSTDEIVAVLAHEIGHYNHHDTITNLIMSIIMVTVDMFIFSLLVSNQALPVALGGSGKSFALALVAFSLLFTPIDIILNPIMNLISRRCEYRADSFAASHGYGVQLISGLKKLSANCLTNLTPHPFVVWFSYSHPTLYQRIIAINEINKNKK